MVDPLLQETLEKPAIMNIGKNLLTDGVIKSITDLVKKKGMIKIKIMKSVADDKEEIIAEIIKETGFFLIDVRGRTFIIAKKPVKDYKIRKVCRKITEKAKEMRRTDKKRKKGDSE